MSMSILSYIGKPALGVLAAYQGARTVVHICGVSADSDNSLELFFPNGHALKNGDLATIHLDNRTGVADYDADLRVFRMSYKGRVVSTEQRTLVLEPRECQVFYGNRLEQEIRQPGYAFPPETRPEIALAPSPRSRFTKPNHLEHDNKVGVLITKAPEQPHTTVLAFLTDQEGDVYFITLPDSYKATLLHRDPHCFFAIDARASFSFDRALEWNYSIIEAEAMAVAPESALFAEVREAFIAKNPWEVAFFTLPNLEMYHLKSIGQVCPGNPR